MSKVQNYKELIVWQKGMELAEMVYKCTSDFPKTEIYALSNQMRRAAVSIVSNVAEGKGRNSKAEYLHFLAIAQGSVCELETQILLSIRLKYLTDDKAEALLSMCDEMGRMLTAMRRKLNEAHGT